MKCLHRDKENSRNTDKHLYYFFQCDCGQIVSKRSDNKTEYCNQSGCTFSKRIRHGKSKSSLYSTWEGINQRVSNPNATGAHTYHGRGITICTEWKDFTVFEKWALSNGWEQGLTIDRIDITGNYEPDNCRWISRKTNVLLQHKDGHGTSKPVYLSNNNGLTWEYFPNKKLCAEYLQQTDKKLYQKATKTVYEAITRSIKNKKDYYEWTFKYAE